MLGTPGTLTHGSQALSNIATLTEELHPILATNNLDTIDLLQQSAPILDKSQTQVLETFENLSQLHLNGLLTPFDSKLKKLREAASVAYTASENFLPLINKAPSLLGAKEPRTYLVAFQNPAEARATGGIIGAYAIIQFNNAKLKVLRVGSNAELTSANQLPINLPQEYLNLYGEDPAIWQNSNLSAHYPYAAKIWLALWQRSGGSRLDGVITLDPFVLQQLLTQTGQVKVNKETINAENVIQKTMSEAYIKYAYDNNARKLYLVSIIKEVLQHISDNPLSPPQLLQALQNPLNEHRILFYSANPNEQRTITKSKISGTLSSAPDNQYRLVVNNLAGNKMDYYLNRAVTITAISCGKKRITQVDYTVENIVDKDVKLPPYIVGRLDLKKPQGLGNSTFIAALLIGPYGSKLLGAVNSTTDEPDGIQGKELGHPVLVNYIELKPKRLIHITARFQGGTGPLTNYTQPLVQPQTVRINDKCSK